MRTTPSSSLFAIRDRVVVFGRSGTVTGHDGPFVLVQIDGDEDGVSRWHPSNLEPLQEDGRDWTCDANGVSNSSAEFVRLSEEVARLIRDSAQSLLAGGSANVGRLVMAQLAHKHGLVPRGE